MLKYTKNRSLRKYTILTILLIGWIPLVSAQFFLRYNHLGYSPNQPKNILVLADYDIVGIEYKLYNSHKKVILKAALPASIAQKGKHNPKPFAYPIDLSSIKDTGVYKLFIGDNSAEIRITETPYAFIPSDILRYFRVQRSGTSSTLDTKASHVGDKICPIYERKTTSNTSWEEVLPTKRIDMRGGWYDAGDYIKFTLTTAYATYFMLRSYELNPDFFKQKKYSKTNYNDLLDEAKHGLDYLMKVMPDDKTFIIQVAGADDHNQGERMPHLDQLDGQRPAYNAFSETQMGYTVAALALGAKLFEEHDPELAAEYKTMALTIFNKALDVKGTAWVEQGWEKFYADESPNDNMALAAIELYRLTGEDHHLYWAKLYADKAKQGYWYSWGNLNITLHLRMAEHHEASKQFALDDLTLFNDLATQKNNIWGVPHQYTWGSLYSFLGVANAAKLFEKQKIKPLTPNTIYNDVLDYTLGRNNWGIAMVASPQIPKSIRNVYSQVYKIKKKLYPIGAVAEGPGDRATHENLKQYFKIPVENEFEEFNTSDVVFYDLNTNFQTMETTIVGLADALFLFTLANTK